MQGILVIKTKKIIAYIIDYFQNNYSANELGLVKLNKILWFADRAFMYDYYKSITQGEYIRNPNGPVLKKLDKILSELEKDGYIKGIDIKKGRYTQKSFKSIKKPDLKGIAAQEISIIDSIIAKLAPKSAKELSKETHDELWEKTKNGDIMPLESVFLKDIVEPTKKDIQEALKQLNKKNINAN